MNAIGRHLRVDGEVSSEEDLTIDGSVTGIVFVRGATLTIGPAAQIEADLRAAEVVVHGTVHGAISASERIELGSSSCVDGSLSAERIAVADGAQFNGHIDMGRRTIAARVAEYRAGHLVVP
jgi:cytoskeletal protein CcmA (bactofilin family)